MGTIPKGTYFMRCNYKMFHVSCVGVMCHVSYDSIMLHVACTLYVRTYSTVHKSYSADSMSMRPMLIFLVSSGVIKSSSHSSPLHFLLPLHPPFSSNLTPPHPYPPVLLLLP
jgi:hypothetical protein